MGLLPEHHPVRDLFVCDVLDVVPRSDMASMAHPIYSLSTKPDMRTLRYENDGVFVEIHPSTKGLATIHDKDLLIYCVSKLMHQRNLGNPIKQVVRITTHDFLVSTNRRTGGIVYERLEDALDRLAGTRIKTNIETGDEKETKNFGLIEWYDYNRKGSGGAERLRYLDVKLSDWLFRAIEAAEVLPISRDYFRLRSPLDRAHLRDRAQALRQAGEVAHLDRQAAETHGLEAGAEAFRGASAQHGANERASRLRDDA